MDDRNTPYLHASANKSPPTVRNQSRNTSTSRVATSVSYHDNELEVIGDDEVENEKK